MWFVYRFAMNTEAARSKPARAIDADIAAFSNSIVRELGGRWVAASARAADGGIEIWYNLAQLPSAPPSREVWTAHLAAHALSGQRITNR